MGVDTGPQDQSTGMGVQGSHTKLLSKFLVFSFIWGYARDLYSGGVARVKRPICRSGGVTYRDKPYKRDSRQQKNVHSPLGPPHRAQRIERKPVMFCVRVFGPTRACVHSSCIGTELSLFTHKMEVRWTLDGHLEPEIRLPQTISLHTALPVPGFPSFIQSLFGSRVRGLHMK